MCVAVPMCIQALDHLVARCEARGLVRTVSLFLLQDEPLAVGDFVLVHLDNAMRRIDRAEAEATWALYDEIFATSVATPVPTTGLHDTQRSNFVSTASAPAARADNDVIGSIGVR